MANSQQKQKQDQDQGTGGEGRHPSVDDANRGGKSGGPPQDGNANPDKNQVGELQRRRQEGDQDKQVNVNP